MAGHPSSPDPGRAGIPAAPGLGRVALVTGGNRGLGFATCLRLRDLGYRVLLTGRDPGLAQAAAASPAAAWLEPDVADPASIDRALAALARDRVAVDVLVGNAGVLVSEGPLEVDDAQLGETFATNVFGPWLLMRALVPAMVERGFGRVVMVSSGAGSFGEGGPTLGTYGVSKAALDALTRAVALDVPHSVDVLVNAVCPGWARTRMGGAGATVPVEDAAEGIVWAATLPPLPDGPQRDLVRDQHHGRFFRDRRPIPW